MAIAFYKGTSTPSTSSTSDYYLPPDALYFNTSTNYIYLNNDGTLVTYKGTDNNTDTSVQQTYSTSDYYYPVLGSATTNSTSSRTAAARFNNGIFFNPGQQALYDIQHVTGGLDIFASSGSAAPTLTSSTNSQSSFGCLTLGKGNSITASASLGCLVAGVSNTVSNTYAHAIGYSNTVYDNEGSTAIGKGLTVGTSNMSSTYSRVYVGQYNNTSNTGQFVVGTGTSTSDRYNGFRVTTGSSAKCYGLSSFSGSGAGVAETWEWRDGNPNNEDRRGKFITLDGEMIRIATPSDKYILGVIDPTPYIVGGVHAEFWKGRFKRDIFGKILTEKVEIPALVDEDSGEVIRPAVTEDREIENPEFDPTLTYVSRDERPEFAEITSHGIVVMIDDGTCIADSYATVGEGGIATHSDTNYAVRVLSRVDGNHIRVYIDHIFVNNN